MMKFFEKLNIFGHHKVSKTIDIYSPIDGEIVKIEEVPDVVFSEKVVGDGIAIKPTGNKLLAPIDGVITKIFDTNHAFSIESNDGIELFVHIGIDTIEMRGEGFTRILQEGQKVNKGDVILEIDLELLLSKSKSMLSPVVISNMDEIKDIKKKTGTVKAGQDVILSVTI